jgi:hypothetical protein
MLCVADAIRHVDNPFVLTPVNQSKLAGTAALLKESRVSALLGSPSLVKLSADWAVELRRNGANSHWSALKSDKGTTSSYQCEAEKISPTLSNRSILEFQKMLPSLGLPDPSLKVRVCKVLRSESEVGPQLLHSDVPSKREFRHTLTNEALSKQKHTFGIILHLDEESQSTHIPDLKWSRNGENALESSCKQCYTSYRMYRGDMMIFRSDLPHAGPANTSQQTRYVLFLMVTPEAGESQDSEQDFYCCPGDAQSPR